MKVNLIYITAKDKAEARKIGSELVESKLAACVNIIDNMNSIYVWEGKIQDDKEVILIAKTTEAQVPLLIEKVKTLHSYDCPCILSIPVSGGNKEFLDWIANEVK
ncbi:MAG: divalent-cation tolerance protein CutA [Planctomycetota bacterium]|jgi:periplasmic divalent cation tolerance protein